MRIQPISYIDQHFYTKRNYAIKKKISSTVSFGDTFDYEARKKEKLAQRPWYKRWTGTGKKKVLDDLNNELIGFNIAQEALLKEKNETIRAKEEALKAKEEAIKLAEEKNAILRQQIENEKAHNNNASKINELTAELSEVKKQYEDLQTSYNEDKSRFDKTVKEQAILAKRNKGKGWDKYVGRELLKQQLQEAFINKIALEKNYDGEVTFPNGIVIYGQHGTGKTYFTPALAEQAGCKLTEIDMSQEPDDILTDVQSELKNSRKRFENEGQRTIILLDDFNAIAKISSGEKAEHVDFDDTMVGKLAKCLDSCAKKYHATIVMTTNYPAKVDSKILTSERVPYKIFLGPPNQQDAALLFKHYLSGENIDEDTVDYTELAEKTAKAIENNEAFSSQGIVNVVNECKRLASETNSKITQVDIIKTINTVGPDITSEEFDEYLDNMQYLYEIKGK